MRPPPAKRRKRLVVTSSAGEEDDLPSGGGMGTQPGSQAPRTASNDVDNNRMNDRSLPTRLRSQQKRITAAGWSPPTSPEKQPKLKSTAVRKTAKPTALDTYFSSNRNSLTASTSAKQARKLETPIEEEDFIEDDSFDDELRRLPNPHKGIRRGIRDTIAPSESLTDNNGPGKLPTGSQVFRKLGNDLRKVAKDGKASAIRQQDTRPWADRYGPVSIEELAIHKKKVADVRDWLNAVCHGRSKKKLLVLKGASGVGKTSTISALAGDMDLEVLEWKNPTMSDFSSDTYVSTSAQFEDFLGRGGKFASLEFAGGEDANASNGLLSPKERDAESRKKVILIEEFPNTAMSSSTSIQSFRASVLRYLATSQPYPNWKMPTANAFKDPPMPLVMIITESQVNSVTSVGDSFTAHRLLGPDILSHPSTDTIEFNSIAPTYITKALNLVIQKEARDSGRRRVPGPSALSRLSEVGDVRSAVGSLEFLCLKGQDSEDWGGRVSSKGKKGPKNAAALTKMEEESLELVTQREASLGLFHAVGKVIYNKREGPGEGKPPLNHPTQPPSHLPQHVRLKPADVSVDDLANETGTDNQTFIAALHENYVLSCAGNDFTDTLNACVEYLSDADVLCFGGKGGKYRGSGHGFQGAATDSLRQEEIAFQVAVRGSLFGLPCPVKRGGLPQGLAGRAGGKGDVYKMFYPSSMRLGRQMGEVEEMVERWMRRSQAGAASTASAGAGFREDEKRDDVTSWAQRTSLPQGGHDGADAAGSTITPSKDAMVLEILPYSAVIERHRPGSLLVNELNRITRVTGEVLPATEEWPDEVDTKATVSEMPPPKNVPYAKGFGSGAAALPPSSATAVEQAVGHLYLSDDDIED